MKISSIVSKLFFALGTCLVAISMAIFADSVKADCGDCNTGVGFCSEQWYNNGCAAGICNGGFRCWGGDCTCQLAGLFEDKCECK